MTVLEAIQKSAEFLINKGVDSPRLQAELLLAHVLKVPRMKLYLDFERKLTETELDSVRDLVKRRGQREPLQHIIGSTSFCGLEMTVNRNVLVPRPETELLAEAGWQFLNGHKAQGTNTRTALDFGTGSGCIAIALAVKSANTRVTALDASVAALEVARQNAERNNAVDRIEFLVSDGFAALPTSARFNLLISNPPYIPSSEIATLQPEVRDFDPPAALDGGGDGLDFYRRLASESQRFLEPEGKIILELGDGQAEAVKQIFTAQRWVVEAVHEDYSKQPRILVARPG